MKLKEVQNKLQEIKNKGFVKSLRRGSTGSGYTFESLFGVSENNIPIPDIGGRVEIKTIRKDSQSLITLFTFNRGVWHKRQKDIVQKYGYIDEKGRPALKNTVFYDKPIPQGLKLEIDENENKIYLMDTATEEVVAIWDVYIIVGTFMTKLSRLLIVLADRKILEGRECFHYNEAYLLTNPSSRSFIKAFKKSLIGIDLRMHLKESGAVRNRGTAFRIKEKDLIELYEHRRRLI
ncbi:MAG TPA: hypothetical protein ENI51_00435 [Candidatus Atribacteria bacterium]|nr:hypothetical protein [Candidatus Atribacteria bacterium]